MIEKIPQQNKSKTEQIKEVSQEQKKLIKEKMHRDLTSQDKPSNTGELVVQKGSEQESKSVEKVLNKIDNVLSDESVIALDRFKSGLWDIEKISTGEFQKDLVKKLSLALLPVLYNQEPGEEAKRLRRVADDIVLASLNFVQEELNYLNHQKEILETYNKGFGRGLNPQEREIFVERVDSLLPVVEVLKTSSEYKLGESEIVKTDELKNFLENIETEERWG